MFVQGFDEVAAKTSGCNLVKETVFVASFLAHANWRTKEDL
jgi:hypothetical protein